MTHEELLLLVEAATAGWHGALARKAILDAAFGRADGCTDDEQWAVYHARLAAQAANRCLNAMEDGVFLGGQS